MGGVLKRRRLLFNGSEGMLRYRLRGILLPLALWNTRRIYRGVARRTAKEIEDYCKSGAAVLGIIGVDAWRTCGVARTLAMPDALRRIARLNSKTATAHEANTVVGNTVSPGPGLYIKLLQKELERRRLLVPFVAHDLVAELAGMPSPVDLPALLCGRTEARAGGDRANAASGATALSATAAPMRQSAGEPKRGAEGPLS